MIVKVFDNIYISNVYNANDIYQLVNLNIGGVLTCFGCKSIDWCYYNIDDSHKIFYKDKFINCKNELKRSCHCSVEEEKNKLNVNFEKEVGDIQIGDNIKENNKDSYMEDNHNLYCGSSSHYDYIIIPKEILNPKLSNNTIKDYVKAMLDLNDDTDIDYVQCRKNEGINFKNNFEDHLIKKNEINLMKEGKINKDKWEISKNKNDENVIIKENQNNTENLDSISKTIDILEREDDKSDSLKEGVMSDDIKNKIVDSKSEDKIQNVCELNKSLREEKKISYANIYKMKHLYLNILDTFDENILDHVNKAHSFIDSVIEEKKNVLVHCMAGISRCSSIILSYVSKKNKKGISKNLSLLKNKYPFAQPNENFYRQLLLYEKMNYTLDGCTEYHNAYKKIKLNTKFLEELKFFNLKNEKDATYKFQCKFCRHTLFNDNDIIKHDLNKYKIKKNYGNSCTSIFIEKKEWLITESKMKGVLYCPNVNCKLKLGKWSWSGICCSCGYLQVPAFMINISNIDRMSIDKEN
ncbi:dual specificity protein phosphatase, putative [Plasmodium gallinaceum]|uniref:protein-tyrosine-phosphatase n=1 Tax=Plasmodium gallinaceum TaxID=5849 RepID=A0A1J1GWC6_PLAGA|nr:dual specificity protein phosphatase, putative [Plasmodium gallinaceum]CRG95317.1 dual specificity protein phosphatase, putative [Plasmodium gallinaceum]